MKRFLTVLMVLGFVMAIAMPAAAVDVKISGSWYMSGTYADNPSGLDKATTYDNDKSWGGYNTLRPAYTSATSGTASGDGRMNRGATSYYTHKLTLNPTIQVVEGLSLEVGVSALQGVMGDNSWKNTTGGRYTPTTGTILQNGGSGGTNGVYIQENLDVTSAYVDFKTQYGRWKAGYITRGNFGTEFLNDLYPYAGIRYLNKLGPIDVEVGTMKVREWKNRNNYGTVANMNGVNNDSDGDIYQINGIYKFKNGEFGLQWDMWRDAKAKATGTDGTSLAPTGNSGWVTLIHTINPYAKYKFANVYVEAEGYYKFGSLRKYEQFAANAIQQDNVDLSAFGLYINARADFKPAYVGGMFVYMSGDDMQSQNKVTGSIAQFMGENYYPVSKTLILWNNDFYDSMGATVWGNIYANRNVRTYQQYNGTRYLDNVWLYQLYGGMNITPKMNVEARITYATADKKPKTGVGSVGDALSALNSSGAVVNIGDGTGNYTKIQEFAGDKYGTEIDLTASYKIYDNLTYSAGFGYLFTGDYFKGYDSSVSVKDNYILTHKLMLNF